MQGTFDETMRRPVIYPPFRRAKGGVFSLILFTYLFFLILIASQTSFIKLGFSEMTAELIIIGTLAGSLINVPLIMLRTETENAIGWEYVLHPSIYYPQVPLPETERKATILAINVGGCLIPIIICFYLLVNVPEALYQCFLATTGMTIIMYKISKPIQGVGIVTPSFIPPISAALIAYVLSPNSDIIAVIAYVGGVLGSLIGADILHIPEIQDLKATFASIGGAGTFDGIFLVGVLAVLLV